MPYATTHILIAILLVELFREYIVKDNKKFPRYYILIAALGAVLPDIDVGIYYVLYFFGFTFNQIHRTFLHSIFVPAIFLIMGLMIMFFHKKISKLGKHHVKLSYIFYILSFASFLHIILDSMFSGAVILFYPFTGITLDFNILSLFPETWKNLILPTIDAILLTSWILWMEFKLKITRYV